MEKPCTRPETKCAERGNGGVCYDSWPCRALSDKDLAAICDRSKHNSAHNKKHGRDIECDGYCATDECVCD